MDKLFYVWIHSSKSACLKYFKQCFFEKLAILTSQKVLKMIFWEIRSYIAKWNKKLKI